MARATALYEAGDLEQALQAFQDIDVPSHLVNREIVDGVLLQSELEKSVIWVTPIAAKPEGGFSDAEGTTEFQWG
jgi:hypothetical protein